MKKNDTQLVCRPAEQKDLGELEQMFCMIVKDMDRHHLSVWDEVYPCCMLAGDLEKKCLYVVTREDHIAAAFSLTDSNPAADAVHWPSSQEHVLYLERLGVHPSFQKQGIGSAALQYASCQAKTRQADAIRLYVAEVNQPAISFYQNSGYTAAEGIYQEPVGDDILLAEIGMEYVLR